MVMVGQMITAMRTYVACARHATRTALASRVQQRCMRKDLNVTESHWLTLH